VEPSMADEFEEGQNRKQSKKTKQPTGTKRTTQNASGGTVLSKHVRDGGQVKTDVIKGPHLKNFYVVKKNGASISGRKSKPTKPAEENVSPILSSDTGRSTVIKALEKLDPIKKYSQSPRKAPITSKPLPVDLDSDSDDLFAKDENLSRRRRERSSPLHSDADGDSLEKSPRKSTKHTSPRSTSHTRAPSPSPSPLRPRSLSSQVQRDVIVIPSDSDEEKKPSILKANVAPLMLAKARAKRKVKGQVGKIPGDDIIDLT